jgi:hypothetical protein
MTTNLFLLFCAALAYAGFCRLVWVDTDTVLLVRLALYLLTVAAVLAMASVLVWGYVPGWPPTALAGAMVLVLYATSRAWRNGVPAAYHRDAP